MASGNEQPKRGLLTITNEDKYPSMKAVEKVVRALFPDPNLGSYNPRVQFDVLQEKWEGGFDGILLRVTEQTNDYETTVRGIMLKKGAIDLDEVWVAYLELKAIAEQDNEILKRYEDECKALKTRLNGVRDRMAKVKGIETSELQYNCQNYYIRDGKDFDLKLTRVTEGEVYVIMDLLHRMRETEKIVNKED